MGLASHKGVSEAHQIEGVHNSQKVNLSTTMSRRRCEEGVDFSSGDGNVIFLSCSFKYLHSHIMKNTCFIIPVID